MQRIWIAWCVVHANHKRTHVYMHVMCMSITMRVHAWSYINAYIGKVLSTWDHKSDDLIKDGLGEHDAPICRCVCVCVNENHQQVFQCVFVMWFCTFVDDMQVACADWCRNNIAIVNSISVSVMQHRSLCALSENRLLAIASERKCQRWCQRSERSCCRFQRSEMLICRSQCRHNLRSIIN